MATITDAPNHNATIYGTPAYDTIHAGNWNDVVYGQNGNDAVHGGSGNDYLNGGYGNDAIHGGNNNDTIIGGNGNDHIYGGAARDYLTGGHGADTFHFDHANYPGTSHQNSDFVTDFNHQDTAAFDGFGQVTWDSQHANFVSGGGIVIAHMNGLEGQDMNLVHTGLHWEASLV
jgi:Ca2+-binding RTX toxin-like protein